MTTLTRSTEPTPTTSAAAARPDDVTELLDCLDGCHPDGLTACPARTVHLLVAHLAGNYAEITRHVDAYLAGDPLSRTRTFDEREPPFREMSAPALSAALEEGEERMRASLRELLDREADPVLRWTNRQVHAAGFLKHSRSECCVHRWDLVGDDPTSERLLSRADLFEHVIDFLGALPMTARGVASGAGTGRAMSVRVRSPGQRDLLVEVHRGTPTLRSADVEGDALLEGDAAARLLFLWGRRATPFGRLRCTGSPEELSRLQWLLSGY